MAEFPSTDLADDGTGTEHWDACERSLAAYFAWRDQERVR